MEDKEVVDKKVTLKQKEKTDLKELHLTSGVDYTEHIFAFHCTTIPLFLYVNVVNRYFRSVFMSHDTAFVFLMHLKPCIAFLHSTARI